MLKPTFSIIIISWNSKLYLSSCLSSLAKQTLQDFEVVLVDNGSSDGLLDELEKGDFKFHLVLKRLVSNIGFAAANNLGVRLAQGKWIVLLNADAFPNPDWLEQLFEAAKTNPDFTFFTSRQIQANAPLLLDGAGDAYHVSGLAWRKYYSQSAHEYGLQEIEVFSACAAAAMYCREDFLKVGGFDEDYFSYFEDVDLSFRLRLTGGRCLYIPQAIVYHIGSASTGKQSDFAYYHGHRNLVWTFFKDMPALLFWFYLPLHMGMNIYLSVSFLLKGKKSVVLRSKIDALTALPAVWRKRKIVQQMRTVNARDIYRVMTKDLFAPHRASRARTQKD